MRYVVEDGETYELGGASVIHGVDEAPRYGAAEDRNSQPRHRFRTALL